MGEAGRGSPALIPGGHRARFFDQLGKPAAHRPDRKCGNLALGGHREAGSLVRKFLPPVQLQASFLQELGRKSQVFRSVHAPEPELFFIPLQKVQTFFKLLHRPVKGTGQKVHAKIPSVSRVVHLNPDAVFAALIAFDAAAIVVLYNSDSLSSRSHWSHQLNEVRVVLPLLRARKATAGAGIRSPWITGS